MKNPLFQLDQFLLWRVATPVGHYIDYRWYFNVYRQAAVALNIALVLFTTSIINIATKDWRMAWVCLVIPPMLYCYNDDLKRLKECSELYEKRPGGEYIPTKALYFHAFPAGRLIFLFSAITLLFGAFTPPHGGRWVISDVSSTWMSFVAISRYLASVLPPTRGRKKKKEREPLAAPLLQPT